MIALAVSVLPMAAIQVVSAAVGAPSTAQAEKDSYDSQCRTIQDLQEQVSFMERATSGTGKESIYLAEANKNLQKWQSNVSQLTITNRKNIQRFKAKAGVTIVVCICMSAILMITIAVRSDRLEKSLLKLDSL